MSFLNNRLGFDFTYYYSLSKDQILNIDIANTTGFIRAAVNSGEMRNKGIESGAERFADPHQRFQLGFEADLFREPQRDPESSGKGWRKSPTLRSLAMWALP